jgi:hypothetical protein
MTGFLKVHFGTDMLMASWLFLFSSCVYTLACLLPFFRAYNGPRSVFNAEVGIGYGIITMISSLLYLDGSFYMLLMTYPEKFQRMMEKLAATSDDQSLGIYKKYFDQDSVLRPFTSMLLGTLVLLFYPFYGLVIGELTIRSAVLFFSLVSIFVWFFIFWMNSYKKLGIQHEGGDIYDVAVLFGCEFCFGSESLRTHLTPDYHAASWIFSLISTVLLIGCVVYITFDVTPLTVLGLISCLPLAVGSYLMLYSTYYPSNEAPSFCYDTLIFQCECCFHSCRYQKKKQVHFADTENLALASFHEHPYIGYNSFDDIGDEVQPSIWRKANCKCTIS